MKYIIKNLFTKNICKILRKKIYVKFHIAHANENKEKYLIGLGKILLGYKMNLKNPQTFNEKINWYKINYENELMYKVVDKIYAKEYVISKNLSEIVIPTYNIFDNLEDINFDKLPNKFVIKNTQDSGGVYVCKDKNKTSISMIKDKLNVLNKEIINGTHWALEKAYNGENKIIVEKLIDTNDGHAPWDYKFFCFNGEPKFLFVATNRDTNTCFDFFDIDFKHLNLKQGHPNSKIKINKPQNYEKMLEICRILSKDFLHVRVDLYNIDGKIYFGELTFYHFAGLTPFKPKQWDYEFGKYFIIKKK